MSYLCHLSEAPPHVYDYPHFADETAQFVVVESFAQGLSNVYRIRNEDGREHALSLAVWPTSLG